MAGATVSGSRGAFGGQGRCPAFGLARAGTESRRAGWCRCKGAANLGCQPESDSPVTCPGQPANRRRAAMRPRWTAPRRVASGPNSPADKGSEKTMPTQAPPTQVPPTRVLPIPVLPTRVLLVGALFLSSGCSMVLVNGPPDYIPENQPIPAGACTVERVFPVLDAVGAGAFALTALTSSNGDHVRFGAALGAGLGFSSYTGFKRVGACRDRVLGDFSRELQQQLSGRAGLSRSGSWPIGGNWSIHGIRPIGGTLPIGTLPITAFSSDGTLSTGRIWPTEAASAPWTGPRIPRSRLWTSTSGSR